MSNFYLAIHASLLAVYKVRKVNCGNIKCGKIKSYATAWLWGNYIIRVRKIKVLIKLLHPIGSYIIEKEKARKIVRNATTCEQIHNRKYEKIA